MSSGAPWWAFIVSAAVSVGAALFSWLMTHRSASKRDLLNWRRTAILNSVSDLLDASITRVTLVNESDWNTEQSKALLQKYMDQMTISIMRLRICNATELAERGGQLIVKHLFSDMSIQELNNSYVSDNWEGRKSTITNLERKKLEEKVKPDLPILMKLHDDIISITQQETK